LDLKTTSVIPTKPSSMLGSIAIEIVERMQKYTCIVDECDKERRGR
jgi:hypothetical protein